MMMQDLKHEKEEYSDINIGLVIAGAVTAGAYSAGVLDYLFETLELWHNAYDKDASSVPRPNVTVDVIAGASAGSIAAAAATLSLAYDLKTPIPPDRHTDINDRNLLFDLWVNLGENEEDKRLVIEKLLATEDLEHGEFTSLLNSRFIDQLLARIKRLVRESEPVELPAYVNPRLKILTTLTNLKGIPMGISFASSTKEPIKGGSEYTMSYHKAYALFEIGKPVEDTSKDTLPLVFRNENKELHDSVNLLLKSARASGAFPIGLAAVPFEDNDSEYIRQNLNKIFPNAPLDPKLPESGYGFVAVDGGTVNNEPIGEVVRLLNQMKSKYSIIILIDPFPNSHSEEELENIRTNATVEKDLDNSLPAVLPKLISTLRKQSHFKENDIVQYFTEPDESKTRHMIWPTLKKKVEGSDKFEDAEFPLASTALEGFSGFLNRDFRVHDYLVGKKNCQNFLRKYLNYSKREKLAGYVKENWTGKPYEQTLAYRGKGNDKPRIPVIPDLRIQKANYSEDTGTSFSPDIQDHLIERPKIHYKEIYKLEPLLEKRVKGLLNSTMPVFFGKKKKDTKQKEEQVNAVEALKTQSWLGKLEISIKDWLLKQAINSQKKGMSKQFAKKIMMLILKELAHQELLVDKEG